MECQLVYTISEALKKTWLAKDVSSFAIQIKKLQALKLQIPEGELNKMTGKEDKPDGQDEANFIEGDKQS